uniref:Retrotransposon, putative, centromere-specific n=1 Tax=Oryza sativa subsp. japonica TaxID=39947 RepID=Q2QT37_ORYSJ|nr:retrotransposon, putative, centromere-specific [Oryza sativa Japonica Group]
MAGLRKGIREHRLLHRRKDMTTSPRDAYEVHDYNFARVESKLPFYDGKYDSVAYIDWELAVDNKSDKYDFSDAHMIKAASNKFTSSTLFWWTYVSNKPETWDECKNMMRKRFVSSYYKCTLREKFEHLKQSNRTVREYIHEFKVCIIYNDIKECNENTMRRFFKGLNSKIQVLLANVKYNHIGHLFMLACSIESQIKSNARKYEQCDLSPVFESPISLCNDDMQTCKEQSFVSPVANVLQGVQNIQQKEENDVTEKKEEKHEAPAIYEDSFQGKLNGAEINEDLEPPVDVDNICKLEIHAIANHIISSLSTFHWIKQGVLNGPRDEHHMEKPRTVFREDEEDDVTVATIDATIAHIMD